MLTWLGPFQVVASSKEKGATVEWAGTGNVNVIFRNVDFEDRQTRAFSTFSTFDQPTAAVSYV